MDKPLSLSWWAQIARELYRRTDNVWDVIQSEDYQVDGEGFLRSRLSSDSSLYVWVDSNKLYVQASYSNRFLLQLDEPPVAEAVINLAHAEYLRWTAR